MTQVVRVLTINTGKCDGAYTARLAWLVEEVRRLQPDIVLCQEAFQDLGRQRDTAGALARRLRMDLAWAPARFKERCCEGEMVLGWSGMAMLSIQPWSHTETIVLPTLAQDGDRVAQIGTIDLPGQQLVVANVHLTYLRGEDELRREELQTVLDHPLLRDNSAMRLICGDFNTTLSGPVLAPLLGEGPVGSLRDAFSLAGAPLPRTTLAPREDGVSPPVCIDHILSLARNASDQPLLTSSSIVLDRPDPESGSYPSDHFGVATTLMRVPVGQLLRKRMRHEE